MNKGMPFWEQHLEKMVLGLSAVILLAVFAMMVLGTADITADIDGRTYGPSEVDAVMVEKAQELGRRLSPDAPAEVEALAAIDVSGGDDFQNRLLGGVSPTTSLPRLAPALAASLLPEDVGSVDVWYWEPSIPAPAIRPQVVQTIDTVEPAELDRIAGLSSMVAANGDVVWATPLASLDLGAMREELARVDDRSSPPRNRIPSNWFNDRPYLLDVVFERQTLESDGSWGRPEIVEVIPGALELRTQIAQARDEDELNANFKEFVWSNLDDKVKQLELLQPEFYATINSRFSVFTADVPSADAGETETPLDSADAARRQQEAELQRRIQAKVASATRLEATLEELGGQLREEDDRGSDPSGSSGSGRGGGDRGRSGAAPSGGGGGLGSGGVGRKTGSDSGSTADRRRRISLTLKLERMQKEIERLREQLVEVNPDAETVQVKIDPAMVLPDLAVADRLEVWTHDLNVVPGATYRYRCRVLMFNPFFARGRQLLPEQQSLAEPFELPSATSDWTNPVTIDPPVEFFVVRGTDRTGSLGLGETRIELYRYFEGAVRKATFTLQPGEPIGREIEVDGVSVDFSTDWYVVDVVFDPAAPEERGFDRDANAMVLCRRLDGTETRVLRPSEEDGRQKLAQYRIDA